MNPIITGVDGWAGREIASGSWPVGLTFVTPVIDDQQLPL